MKKVKVEMFEAEDGTQWKTEAECAKHEASTLSLAERLTKAIVEGKLIAVEGALGYSRDGRDLGALLEEAGRECAAARIAAGDRKRKARDKPNGAPATTAEFIPAPSVVIASRTSAGNPFPLHAAAGGE